MIQLIINMLYRHPKGKIKDIMHLGGPLTYARMLNGIKEMQLASEQLTIIHPGDIQPDSPKVSYLTGKRFWFQTVFCIYSLQKVTPFAIRFHIYDDGSIDDDLEIKIKKQVPGVIVHRKKEIDKKLEDLFPQSRFPYLNYKRTVYPHIKKLIDIHVGNTGFNVVADSDMLFLRTPELFLNWLQNPVKPFHILDRDNFYGFPIEKMSQVCGKQVPEKVNVGLIALDSQTINWDNVESWAKDLEGSGFGSYFLEQALSAMILGEEKCIIGPQDDYIVMPTNESIVNKTGVLHHYVDLSKPGYFTKAWKMI